MVLIPAFSGLSAPYWKPNAKAALLNMSRTTGKEEICRAAEESIAFQIADILDCMREDTGSAIAEICVDGGAIKDMFLVQTQADVAQALLRIPNSGELSLTGVGYLAGYSLGLFDDNIFSNIRFTKIFPSKTVLNSKRYKQYLLLVKKFVKMGG